MADPITAPIVADQDELAQLAYDDLGATVPGWLPSDGDPGARLIQAVGALVAYWATLTGQVPDDIVLWVGRFMLGVPPNAAAYASTTATVTMADSAGHTLFAGTNVALTNSDGQLVSLTVRDDVTVAPAATVSGVGEVVLIAAEAGVASNDLSGTVTLLDNLSFIAPDGIVITGPTTGGIDAETTDAYLRRYGDVAPLVGKISLVLPEDVERYSRVFGVGVYRAKAVRGYNPDDLTSGNEKTIGVATIGLDGLPITTLAKTTLRASMEALREIGSIVAPFDPVYTTINIGFTGVALTGYDPADVETRAEAGVTGIVTPATWALPQQGDQQTWLDGQTKVRFQDVVTALNNVVGFDYYTALTIGAAKAATGVAATDVVTSTAHGYSDGDPVAFSSLSGGAPLVNGTTYFVRDSTANTFKVAATLGGAAIDLTTDVASGFVYAKGTADITLAGVIGLPLPGTIAGTVTAP